jgi:hypothetical protein
MVIKHIQNHGASFVVMGLQIAALNLFIDSSWKSDTPLKSTSLLISSNRK